MFKINKSITTLLMLSCNLACAQPSWEVDASALYLQPSFGGNGLGYSAFGNYAGADNQRVIRTDNGLNHIYNIKPKRAWGFQIGAAYYFQPCNDVRLDWYHLHESVNGHFPHGTLFSGTIDGFYAGDLTLSSKWDAVNLEMGHTIQSPANTSVRLHAGIAYTRIRNTFTNYPQLFLNSDPYFKSVDTISYTGAGPRIGIDLNHGLFNSDFSIFAKTAGSLLIGTTKQSIRGFRNVVNTIYGLIPFGTNNFIASNHQVLVPALEAKIGVNYEHAFARGTFGCNLGYMWMTYLRSMVAYTGIGVVGSSIGVPSATHFDLNGLYLNVSWKTL